MQEQNWIARAGLEDYVIKGRLYPKPLPAELLPYYAYICDSGHSLIILLKHVMVGDQATNPDDYLVPCSVKTVRRVGYHIENGYLVTNEDLPYDSTFGLVNDKDDYEY